MINVRWMFDGVRTVVRNGAGRFGTVLVISAYAMIPAGATASGVAYDLNNLKPDMPISIGYDTKSGVSLGIFRHKAPDGKVTISGKGSWVGPVGAGLFLASKEETYPTELPGEILERLDDKTYKEKGIKASFKNVYFNAEAIGEITINTVKDGQPSSYTTDIAKPTAGEIGHIEINGKALELLENDLTDGLISIQNGMRYRVYFLSRLSGLYMFLVPVEYTGPSPFQTSLQTTTEQ